MKTVIITNITDSEIILSYLGGIDLQPAETRDVTDQPWTDILNAEDLRQCVASGTITVNDGSDDLNAETGLRYISNELYTGASQAGQSVLADGSGGVEFSNTNNYRFMLTQDALPYKDTVSDNWVQVGLFMFCGSSITPITNMAVILSSSADDVIGQVRLYDMTSNNELCIAEGTDLKEPPAMFVTSDLYNIPTTCSLVQIQYRRTEGRGNDAVRLHYVLIT